MTRESKRGRERGRGERGRKGRREGDGDTERVGKREIGR